MFGVNDKVKVHGHDAVVKAVHKGGKRLNVFIAKINDTRFVKADDCKAVA